MKISIKRRELPGYQHETMKDIVADFILFLYDFDSLVLVEWDNLSDNAKICLIKLYVNEICDEYKEIHPLEKEWYISDLCKYYNCEVD